MDAEQAKDLAVDMPPVMQEALDINIKLGKRLEEITAEESRISNQLESKQIQLKQLSKCRNLWIKKINNALQMEKLHGD